MSPLVARPRRPATESGRAEQQLAAKVGELLRDSDAALGDASEVPSPEGVEFAAAAELLPDVTRATLDALEGISRPGRQARTLAELALRAQDLQEEVRRHTAAEREQLHTEVERGLSRLSRIATSAELLDKVCEELVRSCGFTRAMLSRVEGRTWLPWLLHFPDDPELEREFFDWIRGRTIPLDDATLESELLAESRPAVITDATGDPRTHKPIVEASRSTSYVVAPIIPAGRVVGFLHADRHPSREVDTTDGDVIWAFAEGFGRLYERAALMERLRAQRNHVRETFDLTESIMTTLDSAQMELLPEQPSANGEPAIEKPRENPQIDELLTPREREVLTMMVAGHANSSIAERLVIKEGTVKSHVKHILRKLGAVNRVEAISMYRERIAPR